MAHDILIIEDHDFVADATKALLQEHGGRTGDTVIASTADEALTLLRARPYRWRLILLDLGVPGAVGLSLARQIKDLGLASITCVLTGADRGDFIDQLKLDGFLGYIPKAAKTTILHDALTAALEGRTTFAAVAVDDAALPRPTLARLTSRQIQVLQLVATGKTSKEIGRLLDLSFATVDNHITAASAELDAKTRSEAVQKALALGLIKTAQ